MDWIKVKLKHAEYDFAGAPDHVFRAWIMMMMFVAGSERIPSDEQLEARLGKQNFKDLKEYMSRNALQVRYVMDKVMEDVENIQYHREKGKERQAKYRHIHIENKGKSNASHNALVTGADKIRGDKIREDIKKDIYMEFVLLKKDEHQKLIDKFGITETNKYIERLNNYIGSTGKKYKSHYHTILNWSSKDPVKPKPAPQGYQAPKEGRFAYIPPRGEVGALVSGLAKEKSVK